MHLILNIRLTLCGHDHCHSGIDQIAQKADLLETKVNGMKDRKICVEELK